MNNSGLDETLKRIANSAAASVVARGRLNSRGLNEALLRRLSSEPGARDSLLADPVFEASLTWKKARASVGDLSGDLLHPELVDALDGAGAEGMQRDTRPWTHQLAAWQAARKGQSFLVSSGTGSGKTECFMIPILDDLLRNGSARPSAGVRAILIYPLNALIQSQRERLAAWTKPLANRVKFALYNGLTPETPKGEDKNTVTAAEIANRRDIRSTPPSILVTNVTMLEYMLLRTNDREILEKSQGLLRWIILDEAHSYIGAQAAEMALLLRRVRAAFGVAPDDVGLLATSATIGEGGSTEQKLKRFVADLAGVPESRAQVIEGCPEYPELPKAKEDSPLELERIEGLDETGLWELLAAHPRIQKLKRSMSQSGVALTEASRILFGSDEAPRNDVQTVLDAAARAEDPKSNKRLLPWRAHLFHRSQGGLWVCINLECNLRDPELSRRSSEWGFGAVWLRQRDKCSCGSPVFELFGCGECGSPHLRTKLEAGSLDQPDRLVPLIGGETDEFAVDSEPLPEFELGALGASGTALLSCGLSEEKDCHVNLADGSVFYNDPPQDAVCARFALFEDNHERNCCPGARSANVYPQRYGPAFFMGVAIPSAIEALANPLDAPGLPMGGRRALTFSDSRQGTARLAAKLQQDAERSLTRSFLYHSVQENRGPEGHERVKLEARLAAFRAMDDPHLAEDIADAEAKLAGKATPVPWRKLVEEFGGHPELCDYAMEVWRERPKIGREFEEDPRKLAELFLYRELARRPKVQNNAETMGLLRLSFPGLEERAQAEGPPQVLSDQGMTADDWIGLALAAVDFVFRENFAVHVPQAWLRFVSPRMRGDFGSVCRPNLPKSAWPKGGRPWASLTNVATRPSRLVRLVFELTGGDRQNAADQDRAAEVLDSLWKLVANTAARDIGGGAYRLDYDKAAVVRLDRGWHCPVTRRIFGYSPGGRSPYDPERRLAEMSLPRLPTANPGGLDPFGREEIRQWCEADKGIGVLRGQTLWTDLHDRIATYSPFLRAQEHSAQIERPVLEIYEDQFKEGRINLLNCSTTMEMGVDIPDVQMVVNGNVPPSASNYRQRIGRAGRRGELWSFAVTFCRDLPLDQTVFDKPSLLLSGQAPAPAVKLDSRRLVSRHINAALLAAFLRSIPDGFDLMSSAGAFFGASLESGQPPDPSSASARFLRELSSEWPRSTSVQSMLAGIARGTPHEGRPAERLANETAEALEDLSRRWRSEFEELKARREAATKTDAAGRAFDNRARRMAGEFLLSELARRGFTPSYGFPVDVVAFSHLAGRQKDNADQTFTFGEFRGGASRTLDVAIREYAPGSEVVVDGLVHRSEGVFPAWGAEADKSKLEDLLDFWECGHCGNCDLSRLAPENCPQCETPLAARKRLRCLRPVGFLGRSLPHTGYDGIKHSSYEMPRISAAGTPWRALPDPAAGRFRANPDGNVFTLGSGAHGRGFALCLACGRAEPETGNGGTLPSGIKSHFPLADANWKKKAHGNRCPGGTTGLHRIQRNVRLCHSTHTDVFELQLAQGTTRGQGLALAAALREALASQLGTEAREIGIAVANSRGPSDARHVSALLYDRASGGAGFATRLAEQDWLRTCLEQAARKLACPEKCDFGCPSCVLRPDIGFDKERLDRKGGLKLVKDLSGRLDIPKDLRAFGPDTSLLGVPLPEWLEQQRRIGRITSARLYLHGDPSEWEFADWPAAAGFVRMKEAGVDLELAVDRKVFTDSSMGLSRRLEMYRLAAHTKLGFVSELPTAGSAFILAAVKMAGKWSAIATRASAESLPGPNWGSGSEQPLVRGPMPELEQPKAWSSRKLIEVTSGNATLIPPGNRLNARAADFGQAFWKLLAGKAPSVVAAMQEHGVDEAAYSDRYLCTPLAMRLLFEVLRRMPGRKSAALRVTSARLAQHVGRGRSIFDNFDDNSVRREVLQELLPEAEIDIQPKKSVPHARSFELSLPDGRKIAILLDQGFGAWRAVGVPKHDFDEYPGRQARRLKRLDFEVAATTDSEAPIILQEK